MKTNLSNLFRMWMIVVLCLGLIGAARPAQAAPTVYTFVVNTNAPMDPDTNPGDLTCHTASGKCSLYAAIQETNAMYGDAIITFDPTVTQITFTEENCCLPPMARGPGITGYTTLQGMEAVTLMGPNTMGNRAGLTISGMHVTIQGLEITNFQYGIYVSGDGNLVGSSGFPSDTVQYESNSISGTRVAIYVSGDENTISGNHIYGSAETGIEVSSTADGNVVGVSDSQFEAYYTRNVIGGGQRGISVLGDENLIAGNNISQASIYGISISGDENVVGVNGNEFNDMYQANVATDNSSTGIAVYGDQNIIAGNYSGVYEDGSAHPNNNGLVIHGAGNWVGPNGDGISDDLERNVISGNDDYGLILYGANNTIQGNLIGPSPDGLQDRGNGSYGLDLSSGAADNVIGGIDEAWQANQIAYNSAGVLVRSEAGVGNSLRGNSIYENDGMGIDLGPNYYVVNPNDANDADTGPNDLQNYPSVNGATLDGGILTLVGNLQSAPDAFFALDFYSTPDCDNNGYGEGKTYLGSTGVETNADGIAGFEVTLTGAGAGDYITALATNANGSTSEFSACMRPTLGGPLVVNSPADLVDENPGDGLCSTGGVIGDEDECTLRAAVMEANAVGGNNTILVPAGTYEITIVGSGENMARTGDLDLNDHVTIIGAGAATTIIDGGMLDRVFDTTAGMDIEISDVTIQNGGGSLIEGGAILNQGNLRLLRSVVRQNDSWYGALYNVVGGDLQIEASTIYSNTADLSGGGLYVENGTATIVNSTFSGNTAGTSGGGIYVFSGDVAINNATLTLNGCDADAGDAYDGEGGGIYELNGNVTISNTIIAQNEDLQDAEQDGSDAWDCYGAYTSGGYNMIADQAEPAAGVTPLCTGFDADGDLVSGKHFGTPPFSGYLVYYAALGPLADNGSSTPTHMPLANVNPLLVDKANPAEPGSAGACAAADQRGVARPLDGNGDGVARCDRGAVEYSLPTLWVHSPMVGEGQTGVFTVTLQPASEIQVTVQYTATSVDASLGADFSAASGTLTFAPGETEKAVSVVTLQDALVEGSEIFYLLLGNEENASLARDKGVGTILDDDVMPEIEVNDVIVDEGDSGYVEVSFRITLSEASANDVTVSYATRHGNTNSSDYAPVSGQVSFAPGVTSFRVYVQVVGDTVLEGTEVFYLDLSNAVYAVIVDGTGQCTIRQSDGSLLMTYLPLAVKK